jgi:hypothetical protein
MFLVDLASRHRQMVRFIVVAYRQAGEVSLAAVSPKGRQDISDFDLDYGAGESA